MKRVILTERQAEVAALVASGLSDKRIAATLGIALTTVRDHIDAAAERVGGNGHPRHRLTLWFLNVSEDNG